MQHAADNSRDGNPILEAAEGVLDSFKIVSLSLKAGAVVFQQGAQFGPVAEPKPVLMP